MNSVPGTRFLGPNPHGGDMNAQARALTTTQHLPPVFGGANPQSLAKLRPIIESAFDAWLKKTKSAKTRTAYKNDVEQFLSFHGLETTHIEQMTRMVPDDVSSWRDHLMDAGGRPDKAGNPTPATDATVARKITAIRSFFSYLQVAGYKGGNPAHKNFVDAPSMPNVGLTPEIPPSQMIALLDAPVTKDHDGKEIPIGVRDRAWIALLAYMALRVEELHSINVGNIKRDGEHTVIHIKGKGNTTRKGVVPPRAAKALNAWIDLAAIREDRSGPLFRPGKSPRGMGRDGFKRERLNIRLIQKRMKQYCKEVDIDQSVTVHSLRVTAATVADRAGVSLKHIQEWLGHKDPRTTERYIRSGQDLDESPAYAVRFVAELKKKEVSQ